MAAFGAGPAELMVLLMLLGGFGLPLGVPPEPENPAMAYVAPEKCVLYASWAAMAAADPKSTNQTEQLLAEPEVKQFARSLEKTLREAMRRQAEAQRGDPKVGQMARLMPSLAKAVLTRSAAVFATKVAVKDEQPDVEGGLLLDAGDDAKAIVGALVQLLTSPDVSPEEVLVGKTKFYRFPAQKGGISELTIGTAGTYVLLGIGEGSVEGMVDRLAAKKTPAWLAEIQKRHALERRASISMVNTKAIVDAFLPLAGPEGAGIANSLGLQQLGQIETVTGLDEEGMVSRTFMKVEGEPEGLLTLLGGAGIKPEKVDFIPSDAILASAFSLNAQQLYNVVAKVIEDNAPRGAENIDSAARQFEDAFGMRLKEDLLASLGETWTVSMSPVDGWLGLVATGEVRDRDKLVEMLERVKGMLSDRPRPNQPRIEASKFGNHEIQSLIVERFPLRVSWCVTESRVIIGLQPQAVKSALDVKPAETGLFDREEFASTFQGEGSVIAIGYQDSAKLFETTYGLLTLMLPMMAEAAGNRPHFSGPGPGPVPPLFDFASLPSARSIHRHLRPSVSVTRRTKAGVEMEVRQTFPTPSVGASAPIGVALLLPAVQAARSAARRTQSANNLKQIMLAFHNHHDTYRGFPPQATTDKDGKPLLSWRVMILPFIEHNALYQEFHLDEPWDSEHNKKLIAKMPQVYKSPASSAGEGRTVYLGVSGEMGILPASKKASLGPGGGLRMASITDGTSNTIAVVEAGDESAVIWTKPDDFTPDEKEPLKGLLGLYPGGFQVGFCDGSVQFISQTVDPTMLLYMFQRNDGNPIRR